MIIRPSPHKRQAAAESSVQWPPKSPFQALISSPGGKQRWQELASGLKERSPSPSSRQRHNEDGNREPSDLGESDEDESALQLELKILETKKKLRDIQKKQKRRADNNDEDSSAQFVGRAESSPKRARLDQSPVRSVRQVDVPVSPVRHTKSQTEVLVSPARARLGLSASIRAQEVSLKRRSQSSLDHPIKSRAAQADATPGHQPVSSFSQRLAEMKQSSSKAKAKSDRLEALRHSTFSAKVGGHAPAEVTQHAPHYATPARTASTRLPAPPRPHPLPMTPERQAAKPVKKNKNSKDPTLYDPFSQLHLASRTISHVEAAEKLAGSEIYTLPRLLKEVKAPSYDPPDCESDYVVFGIVAEKSEPYKQRTKVFDKDDKDTDAVSLKAPKAKFMVLRLCDLKWEINCYLFGSAFDEYWKLTEGTVVALLNPGILPPRGNLHTGKFSLKVASSEDCILEIGKARDIGTCSAMRKDNKQCTTWTNKSKSSFCEFHLDLQIGRARKGRMEVNTMWRANLFSPEKQPKRNPNQSYHYEHGEIWTSGGGKGAATLLDDEDFNNLTGTEKSRARIAAAQRERDLAARLGGSKGGVAAEYFRAAYNLPGDDGSAGGSQEVSFVKPSAADLGLLGKMASSQRLSPAKDRRRHFGIGAISSAGTEAMGWGGSRKAGLLQPAAARPSSPERGQTTLSTTKSVLRSPRARSASPSKKARFNLAGAIKTPGRESTGGAELSRAGTLATHHENNEDDDLDIV